MSSSSRKLRRHRNPPPHPSAEPPGEPGTNRDTVAAPPGMGSRSRRWGFRVVAMLLPVLVLLMLELALRLSGCGYPTGYFVGHPAVRPGQRVENQRFPWRFFPRTLARHPTPTVVSVAKPPGTCRIVVFGESAAEGDPAPAFGFSRILQVLLRERFPGTRFEVVNTAFTAINSHAIVRIAQDAHDLQGDFWLVYMGNNEVIGPFGAGTIFGKPSPPLPLVRANLALKSTRTGQWLDALWSKTSATSRKAPGWGGMTMFMEQQVRRDDLRLKTLHGYFRQNLTDLVAAGRNAGARVVVSTVPCRLRDWPPFASLHRPDLTASERAEWEKWYEAGTAAQNAGNPAGASQNFAQAARLDPDFAELHYRWGQAALALGQTNDARTHLSLARDLDTLRFRTDSQLNRCIRETVSARADGSLHLLDAEQAFAERSPHGLPGEEWFHEHVHFTFAGNYVLARLFAEEVAVLLPAVLQGDPRPTREWPTETECARQLAFTDSQRYEIAELLRRRFEEPIYRQQPGHADRLAQLERQLQDLRGASKPAARRQALDNCRQALTLTPDDWWLHDLSARLLGGLDQAEAAVSEWREVARLIPHSALPHTEIGKLLLLQANTREARTAFAEALRLNPDHAEAHLGLGLALSREGNRDAAIASLRRALDLDPTRLEAAEALAKMGSTPAR